MGGWWTRPEWKEEVKRSKNESRVFRDREDHRNSGPKFNHDGGRVQSEVEKDTATEKPWRTKSGIANLGRFSIPRQSSIAVRNRVDNRSIFTSLEMEVEFYNPIRDSIDFNALDKQNLKAEEIRSEEEDDGESEDQYSSYELDETDDADSESQYIGNDKDAWIGDQNTATGLDRAEKEFLGTNGTVAEWSKKWTVEQYQRFLGSQPDRLNFGWFGKHRGKSLVCGCTFKERTGEILREHKSDYTNKEQSFKLCSCPGCMCLNIDDCKKTSVCLECCVVEKDDSIPLGAHNQHDGLGWEVFTRGKEQDNTSLFFAKPRSGFWLFGDSTHQQVPSFYLGYEWMDRLNGKGLRENKKLSRELVQQFSYPIFELNSFGSDWFLWNVVDRYHDFLVRSYPEGDFNVKKWGCRNRYKEPRFRVIDTEIQRWDSEAKAWKKTNPRILDLTIQKRKTIERQSIYEGSKLRFLLRSVWGRCRARSKLDHLPSLLDGWLVRFNFAEELWTARRKEADKKRDEDTRYRHDRKYPDCHEYPFCEHSRKFELVKDTEGNPIGWFPREETRGWKGQQRTCIFCHKWESKGHRPGCPLSIALIELGRLKKQSRICLSCGWILPNHDPECFTASNGLALGGSQ